MKTLIIAASLATLVSASAVAAPAHKHGYHRHHNNPNHSSHHFHRDLFALAVVIGAAVAIDAAIDNANETRPHHASAKPNRPGRHQANHHVTGYSINERQHRQQQRIHSGVASGTLAYGEEKNLRRQQRSIAKLEANFRADGYFSKQERAIIQAKLDHASERIYHLKHNDRYR